jgi:uncharacterized membrane protein YfcA
MQKAALLSERDRYNLS